MASFHAGSIRGCVRAVNGVPIFASVPPAAISGASGKSVLQRGSNSSRNQRTIVRASAATVSSKSALRRPREENVEGDFYVDHTCIDCDTCRWMDSATFGRVGDMSAVVHQPETREAREEAMKALITCPTFSIHANQKTGEAKAVMQKMPMAIEECPNVYHTGFSSADSFGSTAYLIVREEGNVLVDSPRFHPQLLTQIKEMGGAKYHFLTHQDDVAGHEQWHTALNTERIIHHTETNASQHTDHVEHQLQGTGPWQLPDGSDDIELIHVPGHTDGSTVLLYKPGQVLFSGDHFGVSRRVGRLATFTAYSSDPSLQVRSSEKLRDLDFLHVLPGHGRRAHMRDAQDRLHQMDEMLQLDRNIHD